MTLIINSIASDPIFAATYQASRPTTSNLSLLALARLESSADDASDVVSLSTTPRSEGR
jgi:hypothetical protein